MASVGPQIYSRRSPQHHRFQVPVPSIPFPLALTLHADVTPFLMCSGLMVVGHRLDRYSLLSVVFAVFHGHSRHGSLAQDILSLSSRSSSRCAYLQLGLYVYPACQDITHRRQFAISFSHRSECFFIALHCFRVSSLRLPGSLSWGHGYVYQKAWRAKVEEDIFALISCILTHLHSPPPTSPLYSACFLATSPTSCLPPCCGLLIYTAVCEQLLPS
jgi:hypothetical protein